MHRAHFSLEATLVYVGWEIDGSTCSDVNDGGDGKMKVAFIENKIPDLKVIGGLLSRCAQINQWANEGPLFHAAYHSHMGLGDELAVFPCSNGASALELLARVQSLQAGRRLRWVGVPPSSGPV